MSRMRTRQHWLLITNQIGGRDLARADWRRYPLASAIAPRPIAGDRVAILRTHRRSYVNAAVFIGTADVHADCGNELELRHRFVAPDRHDVPLASVPHLLVSHGWTDERLGALMGLVVPLGARDYKAIEVALRGVALAYGPEPSRPAHRLPRTPGRRRLITARLMNRKPSPAR